MVWLTVMFYESYVADVEYWSERVGDILRLNNSLTPVSG